MLVNKKPVILTLILISTLTLGGCGMSFVSNSSESFVNRTEDSEPLHVYTSFYPLSYFAERVGGKLVHVHNLTPPGAEPHDFEPTLKDMIALADSDLFVFNGAGFEAWVDKAKEVLDEEKTYMLNATEGLETLMRKTRYDEQSQTEHGHSHSIDPHVWLNPKLAKQQAKAIRDALVEIDPDNAEIYNGNFENVAKQMDELDDKLREVIASADRKEVVVSHAAFGYLTEQYGLKQIPVSGLSPSDEPTQQELQAIIEYAKEHDIRYILFDTLGNTKMAEVVKSELGAEALTLSTLENLKKEELERGDNYFTIMEQNIENLEKALSL